MTAYLRLHPPVRSQYVSPRRAAPTGAVAIHTAEIMADVVGLDSAAEAVASYMTRRTDPGSYHTLVDSDSTINIVDLDDEAFHDGTGGNRWSTSISFAVKAAQWPTLPEWWVTKALERAADAAVEHSVWFHSKKGFHIPARRITAAQYRSGEAGFISHAEIDPGRRTDPGRDFPWNRFLTLYATKLNNLLSPESEEDDIMRQAIIKAYLDGGRPSGKISRDEVWAWECEAVAVGLDKVCAYITWTVSENG